MDPLKARTAFKIRPLRMFALILGIFIIFSFIVSPVPFRSLLETFGIAAMFFLYFFVLRHRPILIECTGCGKIISTKTPWVCGFCGKRNDETERFPFIDRCAHCGVEPKAYRCHHQTDEKDCGEIVFLSEDRQKANCAYCAALPAPVEDKRSAQEIEIQEKKNQITLEQLDHALNEVKEQVTPKQQKPLAQLIQERIEAGCEKQLALLEAVRKKKAENAVKYASNPQAQRLADLAVDETARHLLAGDE